MHCSKANRLLQLYIDGRLPLQQLRTLELHLASCFSCRQELLYLQRIERSLHEVEPLLEPPDLAVNIMRRVAVTQQVEHPRFVPLRTSPTEIAVAALLATIATLGVILGQPSLRAALPFANGHDGLSLLFLNVVHTLMTMNSQTLMLALWVVGTILGVWITLVLAGNEMRRMEWFRSVKERLPVW